MYESWRLKCYGLGWNLKTDDILNHTVLPFLQQRTFDHVVQHDNGICHVARVCQDFLNQHYISVLPGPT